MAWRRWLSIERWRKYEPTRCISMARSERKAPLEPRRNPGKRLAMARSRFSRACVIPLSGHIRLGGMNQTHEGVFRAVGGRNLTLTVLKEVNYDGTGSAI